MKRNLVLATGTVVLGLAVTACGSIPRTGASPRTTAASSAATPAPSVSAAPSVLAASSVSATLPVATATPVATAAPSAPAPTANASKPTTPSAAASPVLFNCLRNGQMKPANFVLTCADAGSVLVHLRWTRWTAQQAVATGVHELNNCTPNCAEGKFINYPVVVTLWRSEPVPGHPGERYFTRITVHYTGPRPPAYTSNGRLVQHPAEWTQPLGLTGA